MQYTCGPTRHCSIEEGKMISQSFRLGRTIKSNYRAYSLELEVGKCSNALRKLSGINLQIGRRLASRGYALQQARSFGTTQLSEVHWSLGSGYEAGKSIGKRDQEWQNSIKLKFRNNHGGQNVDLPNIWLRDNCRCPSCVNQDTMQRAFDTFKIPEDVKPNDVVTEKSGLRITWANDGHVSLYPWEWLWKHSSHSEHENSPQNKNNEYHYWGSEIAQNPPSIQYDEIMADDKGVGKWTHKISKYGFCFVDGCPVSPEETEKLLERIAFIRVTHYGGFYDFTSDLTMKDTAYTSLALGAHTDTTYFTDPAGLQMFHLLSHEAGSGGASLLVDGFKAALKLQSQDPAAFEILVKTPITWHASGNEGITIVPARKLPVLSFADSESDIRSPNLLQVRWNNDDRATVALNEGDGVTAEKWYAAARKWDGILKSEEMEYWEQLIPGRPLIFDNWRVLHGRSAFTGKRRICGGYVNHDDYISRWRNTNFTRDEVLSQIL